MVQWMIERDLEDQGFQRPEMIVLCRGFAFTIEDLLVLSFESSHDGKAKFVLLQ